MIQVMNEPLNKDDDLVFHGVLAFAALAYD